MVCYNSLKLRDLMTKLSELSTIQLLRLKVKALDEHQIRRLDLYLKNPKHQDKSLKELDILDRTPIIVEALEDDEIAQEVEKAEEAGDN